MKKYPNYIFTTDGFIGCFAVLVKVNGKVMQVLTKKENTEIHLQMIAGIEGGIKIIDKPVEGILFEYKKNEK